MKKKSVLLSGLVFGLLPAIALAQGVSTGGTSTSCNVASLSGGVGAGSLFTLLCQFGSLLNSIIPVIIALGVVYFVWGVITYVIASDEEAKQTGRNRIIYGIIGLAVIIGVWGLVNLLRNTFGLNNTQNITIPTVPVSIPGSQP